MKKFTKFLKALSFAATPFLIAGFVYLFFLVEKMYSVLEENQLASNIPAIFEIPLKDDISQEQCDQQCKEEIEEIVSQAISTISGTTKTVVKTETVISDVGTQTAYIPLTGPITTTSTSWVDAVGTDFYLDLNGDYGSGSEASWETFLKIAHGNGQAFARLYDVTHSIAVAGSEVSVTNQPTSTQVSSGNLNFWSGRNLYRVQIKSLNSFEVTFGSGRIKITH